MAWRQRPVGVITTRPRQTNRPIYEDFQPQTEINEQDGARIIFLHVPGFMKEQLRITTEHGNNIRVHGQRPLLNNRWSRFNQLLSVPENCDVNKIHAKFHNGTLTITMPKEALKTESIIPPKEEKPAEKTTQGSIKNITPPKTTDTKVPPPSSSDPNWKAAAAAELRAQKGQENTLPSAAKDVSAEKVSQKTATAEKVAEKGQEGVPQIVTSTAEKDEKQRVEEKIGPALSPREGIVEPKEQKDHQEETLPRKRKIDTETREVALVDSEKHTSEPKSQKGQEEISSEKREDNRTTANEKPGESAKAEKVVSKSSEKKKESTQKAKESSEALAGVVNVSKILDEGKEALQKLVSGAANEEKSKEEDGSSTNGNKLGVKFIAETAKQTVTNAMRRLNEEDRQMLMNIGAAVLVIVALGAYISYSFGSSSKTEN
ncbi:Small heat shock protein HSP [Trema orientale]|uniref:Small heat shock protein HSP n=1 Tax=Trema orientale TaxID=63057 RepID=A0A2P5CDL8_TREOI|nr:Small heat shock protein HSP [Trema orientale]